LRGISVHGLGESEWTRELSGKDSGSLMGGEVIGAKARFDPEKCQKKIFAPLPALLLAGLTPVFS